jgi:hypothetical protein
VCSPKCGIAYAESQRKAKEAKLAKLDRQQHRERKEALRTYGWYVDKAEKAVRDFRRTEELLNGSGCISCGGSQQEIIAAQGWKIGGAFDAGHFLGKGARPELRLEPLNIWLQCKSCNAGSAKFPRKAKTVSEAFRIGLIERIGVEAVEALEADHAPRHRTVEDLKAIAKEYRAKTRELKRKLDESTGLQ